MDAGNREQGAGDKCGRLGAALTRRATFYGIALLALGLLLWARFIIVTGHPRTAIADPADVRTTQAGSAGDADRR